MAEAPRPGHGSVAAEAGSAVVEGVLALGLVLLAVGVGVQVALFLQAKTIAAAAAEAGAHGAALAGADAGLADADGVLAAGGGIGRGLAAAIGEQPGTVSATVSGRAPALFDLGLLLPAISATATAPQEGYPADELAALPGSAAGPLAGREPAWA